MTENGPQAHPATSFPKDRIEVLLLEGIHPSARDLFSSEGFQVELLPRALPERELAERIKSVHLLGIRSKTQVGPAVLAAARRLLAIGCFCIGTDQVDIEVAKRGGVPVFNAPFSNTRSVAELVLAEIVLLARRLPERWAELRRGSWSKSAEGAHEVRGKTLGIVGYGHIGMQVGVLAEALGMRVLFYDIAPRLPLGNNRVAGSLGEVLSNADFVTLHVPDTELTRGMIGAPQLAAMKPGACLLNLSRGTVVVIPALAEALAGGRLGGAAIDVFPSEPKRRGEPFSSELSSLPNVVLTPHIGGSTEEAQESIGGEVAAKLTAFVNRGATSGAVGFPQVEPPPQAGRHRILNVHRNVPGVLSSINRIVSEVGANVESQILATDPDVGYLVMDLDRELSDEVRTAVAALDASIRTRILY